MKAAICTFSPRPLHLHRLRGGVAVKTTFIAVAGSIGAGKSSLIRFLQERFGMHPFYERNDDNPFLGDFYRDMPAFAFPVQVWFLARKFKAHREIGQLDRPAVLDRTIYEDAEVFAAHLAARGIFPPREYETYLALYRAIRDVLPPPSLLIYLKTSVRTQRRRIALRGRPMERGLDPAYLRGVNRLYREWIGRWQASPVLVLDADRLDFVADLAHQADVLTLLRRHLESQTVVSR